MIKNIFYLILIFVFGLSQISFAMAKRPPMQSQKDGFNKESFIESAEEKKVLRIGLIDCISYALKNNSEIRIKRIEPKLREDDIILAKSTFEPTLSADYTLSENTSRSTSSAYPEVFESRDIDFNAGISGKLITGTQYDIDFLNTRYRSNLSTQRMNPYYTSEPEITITQPLFRDFGILVNQADIIIAQNNKAISEQSFKDTVMDIISETKSNYYSYFYYLENYSIAQSSLSRAQYLLEINRARYQKGLVSSVDLLETEAVVAQREKGLIAAEFALKKAEDKLKYITNLVDNPTLWNAEVKLVNRPQFKVVEPDLTESLKDAFEFRPDYESAQIDLASRDIKIKTAKNALFPTVDLVGSFGLNSLGKDYEEAIDKIDSDYKDWSVAVEFSLPWGAGDRAEYDQKKLEKAQALLELKRLEQTIILEIRDKVREVNTQCRQVKAAKLAKEKEEQNYQAQEERYATGYVSTHDILEYQDRLAQAELDYIKGLIDYNVAIIELEESQGLTLARNDIILEGK